VYESPENELFITVGNNNNSTYCYRYYYYFGRRGVDRSGWLRRGAVISRKKRGVYEGGNNNTCVTSAGIRYYKYTYAMAETSRSDPGVGHVLHSTAFKSEIQSFASRKSGFLQKATRKCETRLLFRANNLDPVFIDVFEPTIIT